MAVPFSNPLLSAPAQAVRHDSLVLRERSVDDYTFVSLQDFSMECGICYAYRLNDLIPDKACDDSRCGQPFHSLCLYEVIIQAILP